MSHDSYLERFDITKKVERLERELAVEKAEVVRLTKENDRLITSIKAEQEARRGAYRTLSQIRSDSKKPAAAPNAAHQHTWVRDGNHDKCTCGAVVPYIWSSAADPFTIPVITPPGGKTPDEIQRHVTYATVQNIMNDVCECGHPRSSHDDDVCNICHYDIRSEVDIPIIVTKRMDFVHKFKSKT